MSEVRPMSYIGVSGVVNPDQQDDLLAIAHTCGLTDEGYLLGLGVKAVHKTQWLDVPNKHGSEWYPVGAKAFAEALEPSDDTLNVAQMYFEPAEVHDPTYRQRFVQRVLERGASWLDAVQFDLLPWHETPEVFSDLYRLKQENQDIKVILQCHKPAMELGPVEVVRMLARQRGSFDYILFDASHGMGERMDTERLETFLLEAYGKTALDGVGMAIAGGLDAEVVHEELSVLIETFPDLSWDAEGKLHPTREDGTRPLDLPLTEDYLVASVWVT